LLRRAFCLERKRPRSTHSRMRSGAHAAILQAARQRA
jgi:hypothetical protein